MNKRIGLSLALVLALAVGCSPQVESQKERGPVAVRTAQVVRRDLAETMWFTGEIESPAVVEVKPKVQGRLEKLERSDGMLVTEGTRVQRGEVIGELDRRELEAQAALAAAQERQAEVLLEERQRELRRLSALFKQEVATEQARDAARTAQESAIASLAQAQAQHQLAKVNLDEATLRSPMDGVVTARLVEPGAMVGPSVPIVRITQMDPLRLMLAIPARLVPMLEEGRTAVRVATDVLPGREFDCTIARIFPAADSLTRTVRAEVLLPNSAEMGTGLLRPGMYATAKLTLTTSTSTLTVPASSVIRVVDRQLVYVVRDGVAFATTVKLGVREGSDVEIVAGLSDGDEFVTMGQNKLTDGAAIERFGSTGVAPVLAVE